MRCCGTATQSVGSCDAVVVPGGFAHGDYLRTGAIAQFSPVMRAVADFAASGGPVVGICNGFQVLTEAGLLPGALQKNAGLRFLCQTVELQGGDQPVGAHEPGRARRRPARADQPLRRQLRVRRRHVATASRRGPGGASATSTTRTAASTTSPGSRTRPATWSASCRTLSAPAICSSVRATAWCCLRSLLAAAGAAAGARTALERVMPRSS